MAYKREELDYIAAQLLPVILEKLGVEAQGVSEVDIVSDLTGVFSLPAYKKVGGVEKVVEAPVSLLQDVALDTVKEATDSARAAADEAINRANEAVQAASNATAAATKAGQAMTAAETATEEVLQTTIEVERMLADGKQQIASMKAAELSLMSQALLAPSRMELTYSKIITRRNPVTQYIKVRLFPAYVLQNVIYQQPINGGDSVYVEPSGKLTVNKAGHTKIYVIPTHNTGLYQTVDIEVQEPAIRLTGDGAIRFNSDGSIRLT